MLPVRRRRGRMAVRELGGCSRSFGRVVVVSVGLSTKSQLGGSRCGMSGLGLAGQVAATAEERHCGR